MLLCLTLFMIRIFCIPYVQIKQSVKINPWSGHLHYEVKTEIIRDTLWSLNPDKIIGINDYCRLSDICHVKKEQLGWAKEIQKDIKKAYKRCK